MDGERKGERAMGNGMMGCDFFFENLKKNFFIIVDL